MKKYYKCGTIKIIVKYTDNWTTPKYWGENKTRPEYKITLISAGEVKRSIITAWGNIADAPDIQHKSMAECVIQEVIQDPDNFSNFCFEFGYSEDSIKSLKIWKLLTKRYNGGFWKEEAKINEETGEPIINEIN